MVAHWLQDSCEDACFSINSKMAVANSLGFCHPLTLTSFDRLFAVTVQNKKRPSLSFLCSQ